MTEAEQIRPHQWRQALIVVVSLLALALLALWLARKPIAADLIDRELARRGVPATYQVKRIGLRTQRLEGLVVGDPRAPDLTAQWVEIDLRPTFGTPELVEIRVSGVRARGRLVNGRLTLGTVDRLLGPPTGQPFRLPDLKVGLTDARLALKTAAGAIDLRLKGRGNLANSFAGRYAVLAPALTASGCEAVQPRLTGQVRTRGGRPHFDGPVSLRRLNCGSADLAALTGTLDATLEPGFNGWRGFASLASGAGQVTDWSATGTRAQIDFAGNTARTSGSLRLAALSVAGPQGTAPRAELGGRYTIESARAERLGSGPATSATNVRFEGGLSAQNIALANAPSVSGLAAGAAGTPIEPLMRTIERVVREAGRSSNLRARLSLSMRGGGGSARIAAADIGGGGAELHFTGGDGIRLVWPGNGQPQVDGRLVVSGGGLPRVVADLRQSRPGVPISGIARIAPYTADGARIALQPVRFEAGRFNTMVAMSGPLAGGRVEGATLALTGRIGSGGFMLNPGCAPLAFKRLSISGLVLEPARLRLCPPGPALVANGRAAGTIVAPNLRGRLGSSPITLAAARARFDGNGFGVDRLSARLGGSDRLSRLDIATLTGSARGGLAGRFSGASGQIGNVPLIASNAAGRWRFGKGALDVTGGLTLADAPDPARFNPLVSRDFTLRIAGRSLTAGAHLLEPASGAQVAQVALRHDLTAGIGHADIATDLRFGPALQPERITRLTLGVVADVVGSLKGQGNIAWNPNGVTSTGAFRMEAASLSAPFGPVTGVAGDIRFTDLLGLVTVPDQRLTVATINPGILVEDGVVSYRLVPGLKIAVDRARWPLAGGELILRPTILDFSAEAARNLTFDVTGLNAARFINQLEFRNINATGIFDGTLPMVFDQDGGRITGGALASRAPGGTLSYIGEVSNANLGIWGGIAFDALKSIAYRNMTIGLNGKIDGEMVTQIRFNGVSRGTIQPVATGLIARIGGRLASRLQQLPFIFNIQIKAPFRGLISTARSFYDPSLLIQDQLGPQFQAEKPPVQPPVSRKQP